MKKECGPSLSDATLDCGPTTVSEIQTEPTTNISEAQRQEITINLKPGFLRRIMILRPRLIFDVIVGIVINARPVRRGVVRSR